MSFIDPYYARDAVGFPAGRERLTTLARTTAVPQPAQAERGLIQRAQAGDVDAYGALITAHARISLRLAFLITGSPTEAEDVVQNAFANAFRALARFRPGAPFRPWLLQIVANEARDSVRRRGRRRSLAQRLRGEPNPGLASDPEAVVIAEEQRRRVLRALRGLREEERLVLTCRYLLELSEAETAQVLRIRPGTVKSRCSRGLARLRLLVEVGP